MNIIEKGGSIIFPVRVVPRASKSRIVGEHDDALKIQLVSPPVDGAANAELFKLLAKMFGVSKSDIDIVSGQTSRSKQVRILGLTQTDFHAVLKAKT